MFDYIQQENKICIRQQNRKVVKFCRNLSATSKQ